MCDPVQEKSLVLTMFDSDEFGVAMKLSTLYRKDNDNDRYPNVH